MKNFSNVVSSISNVIFRISFSFYLLFFIIDLIKPGFIVNFFYLNIILVICFIALIFTLSFPIKKKELKSYKKILTIFLNLLITAFIIILFINAIGLEYYQGLWVSMIAGLAYFFNVLLFVESD